MTNLKYGFIDSAGIIWLCILSFIMPSLYTLLLQLSTFCTSSINTLLQDCETLSLYTYMHHDAFGNTFSKDNSEILIQALDETIVYSLINAQIKRKTTTTKYLNHFIDIYDINLDNNGCMQVSLETSKELKICPSSL